MDLVVRLEEPRTRGEALSELLEYTPDQLRDPIPSLLNAVACHVHSASKIETRDALLHFANNGYCLRALFLHRKVAKLINDLFFFDYDFSFLMLARLLANEENQREALYYFPGLIHYMFKTKTDTAAIAQIAVHLIQCHTKELLTALHRPDFTSRGLNEIELNVVGLLAKLPDARLSLVRFHGLTEALVRHRGRAELKHKALEVLANLLVGKDVWINFPEKYHACLHNLASHECQLQAIPILHTCFMNNGAFPNEDVIRVCVVKAREEQDNEVGAAWLRFFRGPEGNYPILMSLTDFEYMLHRGPDKIKEDFLQVTREEFASDYQLLQHGAETRQHALQRLCQRATAWYTLGLNHAWTFSTTEDIQLLLQSWETHKADVRPREWVPELRLFETMSYFRGVAITLVNVPGVMDWVLGYERINLYAEEQICRILRNFARNDDFVASPRCFEAMPRIIQNLNEHSYSVQSMAFKFINLAYIDSGKLREAYLCPGLVDTLLLLVYTRRSYDVHAFKVLDKLCCLLENKRDMVTRVGFMENLIAIYATCRKSKRRADVLCRILLRLRGRIEPNPRFVYTLYELDETAAFWHAVLAVWTLRSPRFVPRLRASNLVIKLPPELARMVLGMLI